MEKTEHPLVQDQVFPLRYWKHWYTTWKANTSAEVRTSLLHCGFQMYEANQADRILFYLKIAERARTPIKAENPNGYETIHKARIKLSQKALEVLCQEVFKHRPTQETRGWLEDIQDEKTLNGILDFFRLEDHAISPRFANSISDLAENNRKIVEDFLVQLALLGWRGPYMHEMVSDKAWELFQSKRPQFVDILFALGELWRLISDAILSRKQEVDESTLKRLEEMALKVYIHVPYGRDNSFRAPESVEEAAAFGSQAAKILILSRVRNAEIVRLRELHELEIERRNLERRQQELTAKR